MRRLRPRPPLQLPQEKRQRVAAQKIGGLHDNISATNRSLSLLSASKNLVREGQTAAKTRTGTSALSTVLSATSTHYVLGAIPYYKSDGTKFLVSGAGTEWKAYNGTSWASVKSTGITANKAMEGVNFTVDWSGTNYDSLIICNGQDIVQKVREASGTWYASDLTSAKNGAFIATAFGRVFLAGGLMSAHLFEASDILRAHIWPDTPAASKPDDSDPASIEVNYTDGDKITWLKLFRQNLLIFKRYSVHELHGPEVGQVSKNWSVIPVANVGTPNGRTVAEVNGTLFWLSDEGVVAWSGGRQQIISEPIKATLDAINWSQISTACGGTDGEYLYFLSLPLDANTEPNVTMVYDTRDSSWWRLEDFSPRAWAMYRVSSTEVPVFGDSDRFVYQMTGTDDGGVAIGTEATFGPSAMGMTFQDKWLRRAYFVVSLGSGATLTAATASSDTAAFGSAVSLSASGTAVSRIRKFLPLTTTEEVETYVPRLKLTGTGVVTIHDVGIEYAERDS